MRRLRKTPGMVFIIDPSRETLASVEANKLGIPVVGTADTNVDPDQLQYPIPVNDDAIKCIRLICSAVADAVIAIGAHEHIRVVDLFHEKSLAIPDLVAFKHLKDTATGAYRNFPYPDYIGVPFNPDTDEYPYPPEAARMTFDGLHPSDAGYEVITKLLLEAMRK